MVTTVLPDDPVKDNYLAPLVELKSYMWLTVAFANVPGARVSDIAAMISRAF